MGLAPPSDPTDQIKKKKTKKKNIVSITSIDFRFANEQVDLVLDPYGIFKLT